MTKSSITILELNWHTRSTRLNEIKSEQTEIILVVINHPLNCIERVANISLNVELKFSIACSKPQSATALSAHLRTQVYYLHLQQCAQNANHV